MCYEGHRIARWQGQVGGNVLNTSILQGDSGWLLMVPGNGWDWMEREERGDSGQGEQHSADLGQTALSTSGPGEKTT